MPDAIKNVPELFIGSQLYLDAFFELDLDRDAGFGLTPIKRKDIFQYCRDYNLSYDQTESMLFLIKRMDAAHIKRVNGSKSK